MSEPRRNPHTDPQPGDEIEITNQDGSWTRKVVRADKNSVTFTAVVYGRQIPEETIHYEQWKNEAYGHTNNRKTKRNNGRSR